MQTDLQRSAKTGKHMQQVVQIFKNMYFSFFFCTLLVAMRNLILQYHDKRRLRVGVMRTRYRHVVRFCFLDNIFSFLFKRQC